MLTGTLHCEALVTDIDTDLSKSLLGLVVKLLTDLLLMSGFFVDPETDLVSESLVEMSSWQ